MATELDWGRMQREFCTPSAQAAIDAALTSSAPTLMDRINLSASEDLENTIKQWEELLMLRRSMEYYIHLECIILWDVEMTFNFATPSPIPANLFGKMQRNRERRVAGYATFIGE